MIMTSNYDGKLIFESEPDDYDNNNNNCDTDGCDKEVVEQYQGRNYCADCLLEMLVKAEVVYNLYPGILTDPETEKRLHNSVIQVLKREGMIEVKKK